MVLKDVAYGDAKIVVDWLNTGRYGYVPLEIHPRSSNLKGFQNLSDPQRSQYFMSLEDLPDTPGYVTHDGIY
jgi:hypothetical protein